MRTFVLIKTKSVINNLSESISTEPIRLRLEIIKPTTEDLVETKLYRISTVKITFLLLSTTFWNRVAE